MLFSYINRQKKALWNEGSNEHNIMEDLSVTKYKFFGANFCNLFDFFSGFY